MNGFILAAGLGTRLRPYSSHVPKPLFPVLGVPLIRWILAGFAKAGVLNAVVNLHHLGDRIVREIEAGPCYGVKVTYSFEDAVLGTGGALTHAFRPSSLDCGFLLHNGDIFSSRDLCGLASGCDVPVLGVVDGPGLSERRVEIDDAGRVVSLRGLPRTGDGRKVVYGGVAWITPEVVETIRKTVSGRKGQPACLVADGLLPMITEGREVVSDLDYDEWYCDIGTPESYLELNRRALRNLPALFLSRGFDVPAEIEPGVFVQEGAAVSAGVTLTPPVMICRGARIGHKSIVGPDAVVSGVVEPGANVSEAVVLPGAVAAGNVKGILVGK